MGRLFIRKSPIPAFSAISCVKSLRAISMHAAKRLRRAVFHATNRGSNAGVTLRATQLGLGKLDRASTQIYWRNRSQVLRRILRTCRENIAYNTLPYNSARMLLLPHAARSRGRELRRVFGTRCTRQNADIVPRARQIAPAAARIWPSIVTESAATSPMLVGGVALTPTLRTARRLVRRI